MATKAQWFESYVQFGLQPIALYKGKKNPVGKNWNVNWEADKWRPYFKDESYDMGILLGNIVDVEGDTEYANEMLRDMTKSTPHPMFRSSKSTHHLFLNPDRFLTRKVFNGIEFRANRHQSVVPPSTHEFGSKYGWLSSSKFLIPEMPKDLLSYYNLHKSKSNKEKTPDKQVKIGHTQILCKVCNEKYFIHKKRFFLESLVFEKLNLPWACHGCRECDIRNKCRSIRIDHKIKNKKYGIKIKD